MPLIHSSSCYKPCFREKASVESWIRPPPSLLHSKNEFGRATFVAAIKEYPYHRIPKIAFMFLTKESLPLAPLWERFFKGHEHLYSIYVHSPPSYNDDFSPPSVFYRRQIPSQPTEWGTMSMCDSERRLLANAMLDLSNEYFILLSESCIPIQNFTTVYNYISQSQHSFMDSFDEPRPYGRGHYNENMAPLINLEDGRKGPQWKILQQHTCSYNGQPSSLCFLFARKFAPDAILDIVFKARGI
ncbi:hypothetical protein K1719_038833 [Acacia pycnantha]|nr:hypothetical protein K1719_038833 [Acacia pycnantha]